MDNAMITPRVKRIAKVILKAVVGIVLFVLLYFLAVDFNLFGLFGSTPSMDELRNPPEAVASEVYSKDNHQLIGKFYQENRSPVAFNDISPIIVRALVATEDARFYQHSGIDFQGLIAAAFDATRGRSRGASTITQQLAKNRFAIRKNSLGLLGRTPGLRILVAKSKEWIVATKLEHIYSKEEILEMYLNTVDFGNNAYGIKTATNYYFDKQPADVTYEEAAMLVGLLKATTSYNPRHDYDRCLERRNTVLSLMADQGAIVFDGQQATPEQVDSLKALPIHLSSAQLEETDKWRAPYFRDALVGEIERLYKDNKLTDHLDPYRDGLKIYTTLDTRLQTLAERAVKEHMTQVQRAFRQEWGNTEPWRTDKGAVLPDFLLNIAKKTREYQRLATLYDGDQDSIIHYLREPHPGVRLYGYDEPQTMSTLDSIRYMVTTLHCGFVCMEPGTREVKAWVGDVDYDHFKFNNVQAQRQPGSTFKLFVYTEAMRQGLLPTDTYVDKPQTYTGEKGEPWTPHNANGNCTYAATTVKRAFAQSINTIAVQVGVKYGIDNIVQTAHDMGIRSQLRALAPLCLGASEVNLLEMTNAYSTVAADGQVEDPVLILRIEDHDGNLIYEHHSEAHEAIPASIAAKMQKMLLATTEGGGTSRTIYNYVGYGPDYDIGGKTGTTNNHSDAWYMGVTPGLVGGVWVGGEYRAIHFRSGSMGQGSKAALPIWGRFIAAVMRDRRNFPQYHRRFVDVPTDSLWDEPADTIEADSVAPVPPHRHASDSLDEEPLPEFPDADINDEEERKVDELAI